MENGINTQEIFKVEELPTPATADELLATRLALAQRRDFYKREAEEKMVKGKIKNLPADLAIKLDRAKHDALSAGVDQALRLALGYQDTDLQAEAEEESYSSKLNNILAGKIPSIPQEQVRDPQEIRDARDELSPLSRYFQRTAGANDASREWVESLFPPEVQTAVYDTIQNVLFQGRDLGLGYALGENSLQEHLTRVKQIPQQRRSTG